MINNLFPYRSLFNFLEEKNLLNAPALEIQKAKLEYERIYQIQYQQTYKKQKQQLNLILDRSVFFELTQKATLHHTTATKYVRSLIIDDVKNNSVLMPPFKTIEIENLVLAICDNLESQMKRFPDAHHVFTHTLQNLEAVLSKLNGA